MTDPVLDRVRAADPAAADPALLATPPDRARVTAARRRRHTARVARAGVPASALAVAAVVAALVPGGGGSDGLAVADVVARAAVAADLPANRIVVIRSEVDARWDGGGLWETRTTWVRLDARGEPVAVRSILTDGRGENVRAGAEEASSREAGTPVLERLDPETGEVERVMGEMVPSPLFRAERLLDRARRGDTDVRLAGETTYAGRRVLRVSVPELGLPERIRERRELLVDAETYRPLATTVHTEGIGENGKPFTYALTERVVDQRVLPDDAEHRAQVKLGGPRG